MVDKTLFTHNIPSIMIDFMMNQIHIKAPITRFPTFKVKKLLLLGDSFPLDPLFRIMALNMHQLNGFFKFLGFWCSALGYRFPRHFFVPSSWANRYQLSIGELGLAPTKSILNLPVN